LGNSECSGDADWCYLGGALGCGHSQCTSGGCGTICTHAGSKACGTAIACVSVAGGCNASDTGSCNYAACTAMCSNAFNKQPCGGTKICTSTNPPIDGSCQGWGCPGGSGNECGTWCKQTTGSEPPCNGTKGCDCGISKCTPYDQCHQCKSTTGSNRCDDTTEVCGNCCDEMCGAVNYDKPCGPCCELGENSRCILSCNPFVQFPNICCGNCAATLCDG
jgi:hypothetical protein